MADPAVSDHDVPVIDVDCNLLPDTLDFTWLHAGDGARLRAAFTTPPEGSRGTVIIVPGWAEFIEKYGEVLIDLRERKFATAIYDPRGQGLSQRWCRENPCGLVTDFDLMTGDLDLVMAAVRDRLPPPYFILSHSMGGLITLRWLAGGGEIDGAALSAPLTRLSADPVRRQLATGFTRLAMMAGQAYREMPGVPPGSMKFDGNVLTQDKRRHERFRQLQLANEDAMLLTPKIAWVDAAIRATNALDRSGALDRISVPILMVSAGRDETVDPAHHPVLAERYDVIEYHEIDGARHELLMEQDQYRDQFWSLFDTYVEGRLSALADRTNNPPNISSTRPDSTRSSIASAS